MAGVGEVAVAVLGSFLNVAFERVATPIIQDFKRACGVEQSLDDLQQTLDKARALLIDADRRTVDAESDRLWLDDLEAAVYEADNIVDEFYYAALRHQVEGAGKGGGTTPVDDSGNRHGRVRKRDKFKRFFNAIVGIDDYHFRHEIAGKIQDVIAKFEGITERHQKMNPGMLTSAVIVSDGSVGGSRHRETSSLVSEPYVFGRKPEVEQIVKILLRLDASCGSEAFDPLSPPSSPSPSPSFSSKADENLLPVLPIVGMAGIGKTTLAQLVFNDDRVKGHFNILMWVCVSNNFDLGRLTRQIFHYVATADEKSSIESTHLDVLQTNLRRKLEGKRFLLVLDDLWNEERSQWHKLRAPLLRGHRGSAVLVTTRKDAVAETSGTMDAVRLQGLSFDDCYEMLLRCASVDGSISKSYFSEDVCRRLVQKINGVPLAVKTLGDFLSSKKSDHWEEILEREFWELQQKEGDILPVLRLSYEDLPAHLKRCFAYCSLFPVDYEFDKLKLVKIWMALDFIQTKSSSGRMEDVGSSYFDELLKRSFFQKVDKCYLMHTLYHGLAKSIPNRRSVSITEQNSATNIHDGCLLHMSLSITKVETLEAKPKICNSLRSFIFLATDSLNQPLHITDSLFSKLSCLRVLDLSWSNIEVLPESIGNLIHLRFLDVSHAKVEALPNSLSLLYNLQSLELNYCHRLKRIPSGVNNLINLRHLSASNDLINTLPGIGKLSSLQELKLFNVSREEGHGIQELRPLNELRNKLWICNIQNLQIKEDESLAILESKKYLHELILEWSVDLGPMTNQEGSVVEVEELQPPKNLKVLSIIGSRTLQPPSWMKLHYVDNLTSICLRDCRNWKNLPPLGALLYLEFLKIEYLLCVEEVGPQFYGYGVGFPSLKALQFRHMQALKIWLVPSGREVFPLLEKLMLEDCPQLENVALPSLPRIIKIEKCPKLLMDFNLLHNRPSLHSLSWSFENSYQDLPSCISDTLQQLNFLERLEISFYDESVAERRWSQRPLWMPYSYSRGRASDELDAFSSKSLSIHDSSDLRVFLFYAYNFPDYPDVKCCNLSLRIRNYSWNDDHGYNSLSACLQDHLISLQLLTVKGCNKVEVLLGNGVLSCLKTLNNLNIEDCKGMISLGWFPRHEFVTLRLLKIANCPDFNTFPPLKFTVLEKLLVENCEDLSTMDLHGLTSLKCLKILGCSKLRGRCISGKLTVLKELNLKRCPNLVGTLDDMEDGLQSMASLQILEISLCQTLTKLPENLQALTSLKRLSIMQSPEIRSLPKSGLPSLLNELQIEGCPLLQQKCQMGGSEWPRVSYIPKRTISCPKCSPYSKISPFCKHLLDSMFYQLT